MMPTVEYDRSTAETTLWVCFAFIFDNGILPPGRLVQPAYHINANGSRLHTLTRVKGGDKLVARVKRGSNPQHEVLLLCSSTWFLIFSAGLVPGITLPLLRKTFSLSLTQAGGLMTVFWLMHALVQSPAGFFSDRHGARTVIGMGLFVVTCGEILTAFAHSFAFLLVSFAVLGLGLGSYPPAGTALLARTFGARKGRAFGIHSAVSSLGGVIPLAIPLIVGWLGWRGLHVAYAVCAIPLGMAFLWHRHDSRKRNSWATDGPSLKVLLLDPSLRWLALLTVLFVSAWQAIVTFLPTFLVAERELSLRQAGAVFATIFLCGLVIRPMLGILSDYVDRRRMLLLVCTIGGIGALTFVAGHTLTVLVIAAVMFSVAGSFFLIKNGYLLDMLRGKDAATALGLFNTLILLCASQSSALLGAVGDRYSLGHGLALFVGLLLIAGLLSLKLRESIRPGTQIDSGMPTLEKENR